MSGAWTPGPWKVEFKHIGQVRAENGALIAKAQRLTTLYGLQANARLMAAAPDLAEALEALLDALETGGIELDWMSSPTPLIRLLNTESEEAVVERARAALAKAKGEVA